MPKRISDATVPVATTLAGGYVSQWDKAGNTSAESATTQLVARALAANETVDWTGGATGGAARTAVARAADTVSAKDFGAVGDSSTDDRAAFVAAVTATPAGGTLYVPPLAGGNWYALSGGLVTNKPIRIIGGGKASRIRLTGTTGFNGFLWAGGAISSGTPYANYAAGTLYTFDGDLTVGQLTFTGIASTTGLAVGDDVYLGLGTNQLDGAQHQVRMWNRITALTSTSVTLAVPLPEAVAHASPQSAFAAWAPAHHELVKFTVDPNGFEVGNLSLETVSGPTWDTLVYFTRARNCYAHDLWVPENGCSFTVSFGECENSHSDRIYVDHGPGVDRYGCRGGTDRNWFVRQLVGRAYYIEDWNRGVLAEQFTIDSGSEHGTEQILQVGGGVKNVTMRGFTFNQLGTAANFIHDAGFGEQDEGQLTTENFTFQGDQTAVNQFNIRQHRGRLEYNGMVFNTIKTVRKRIMLTPSMSDQLFTLGNGIVKRIWFHITDKTGLQFLRVVNSASRFTGYAVLFDSNNTIDYLPAVNTMGYPTTDQISKIGSAYPLNQSAGAKAVHVYTLGTVSTSAPPVMTVVAELYVPIGDDGVVGSALDLVDRPAGVFAQDMLGTVTAKTMTLCGYTPCPGVAGGAWVKMGGGTATVAIQINGTNVTSLSALAASTTGARTAATGANGYPTGSRVTAVITSPASTPVDLEVAVDWTPT